MKVTLIVNGSASSVTPRTRVLIQRALSSRHEVTAMDTTRRGHATRLASGAAADGADAVVVLGGDGTLNEVANGLAGSDVIVGALPGGSTNVFARTVGFTNDPIDATGELLTAMESGNHRRIGLGNANGRYFLFHVGLGFDAAVVERAEKTASLKRYAGHPLFVWSTMLTLARYNAHKTGRFAVRFDSPGAGSGNAGHSVDGYYTICLNSNPYSYLGKRPLSIVPGLDFEKGLAVITIKSLTPPTFFGIVGSALMSGRYLRHHPKTDLRTDVNRFVVNGYDKFPYQLDGEYLGDIETIEIHHEPSMLDVFMPIPAGS
jgi:diacylglycerol kinase family enzyme